MSQLKAFKLYKALSGLVNTMISAFVPLIIYQYTDGNIYLALSFLLVQRILTYLFKIILKTYMEQKAELFLLLRTIPIVLFQICLALINYNVIVFSVLMCIFNALSFTLKDYPSDCIQNYSSQGFYSSAGVLRLLEYLGSAVAAIFGGVLLDYIGRYALVIISLVIYVFAVLPLLIVYIKNRKNPTFNKEMVSTATLSFGNLDDKNTKLLQKSIIRKYFLSYYLISIFESVIELLPLYFYIKFGNFSMSGYLTGFQYALFGLGSYLTSKLYTKKDLHIFNVVCAILSALFCCSIPFVQNIALLFFVYGGQQFFYSCSALYIYNKMTEKSKILGITNQALYYKNSATYYSYFTGPVFSIFIGVIYPVCFLATGMSLAYALYYPIMEESARRQMVDYLQDNDIKLSRRLNTHFPHSKNKNNKHKQRSDKAFKKKDKHLIKNSNANDNKRVD